MFFNKKIDRVEGALVDCVAEGCGFDSHVGFPYQGPGRLVIYLFLFTYEKNNESNNFRSKQLSSCIL